MDTLISKLRNLNIRLNLVEGKLKINAPKGAITPEILQEIKANKEALIEAITRYHKKESFYNIPKAEEKEFYELSLAQKRLYFIYLLDPQSSNYNIPQFYKIKGQLNVPALETAFKKLIDRHASFRTAFSIVDDHPMQSILPQANFAIEHYTCEESELPAVEKAFIRPFDLSQGDLLRVGLVEVGHEDYRLLLDSHHIINDGESNNIIFHDLILLYDGEVLDEPKTQYIDYSEWQNSADYQEQLDLQKNYWKSKFVDFPGLLDLTLDYKTSIDTGPRRGEGFAINYDTTTTKALKSVVDKEGTTMFILILAILNILLSKISNQEDITIGSPVAGRHHPDLKNIVGMFVNSLPLRNFPSSNKSFKTFLSEVTLLVVNSFDNQDFHYEQLVNELQLERVGDKNPLFNILYTYQNGETLSINKKSNLEITSYGFEDMDPKFDLIVTSGEDEEEKLFINLHYATKIFGLNLVKRIAEYFKKIIAAIIANDEILIGDIDVLTPEEKKQLLGDFNNTRVAYPKDQLITDLFAEQVRRTPNIPAVLCGDIQLTYQALEEQSNQLANYLINTQGLEPGSFVGLYTRRSASMIVALWAILKTGAAYIPIDPKTSVERLNKIVDDAKMKVLLTDKSSDLAGLDPSVVLADFQADHHLIAVEDTTAPQIKIERSDSAYIIYTSGSTGKPKGILIEHSSLLDYTLTFKNYFGINENDRVIQQASLAFDTAVEEIFPALVSGAGVMVIPEGGLDIDYMLETIKYGGATVLSTTPLVLNELNSRVVELANLRIIISGGDLLLPAHISEILKRHTVYNTYGPSESTVCISYNKIEKPEDISYLGKPIANRQVYITNKYGGLCPILVPGELCVSGEGLARGYIHNEKLTSEKFVENPFVPGERMYKTGDMARWLPDGNIEFLGRIDHQVKIRGVRIELGEIENLLAGHEQIQEVVVTVKEKEGEKFLVAYYVAAEEIPTKVLMDFLSENLPVYMVPSYYVYLEKLPLTSSGKPNLKKLPQPEVKIGGDYVGPTTEIQEKLVAIWAELLNLEKDKISINRSFFELGGHSLKAINLISKMEKEFGVKIKLRIIFTKPTIRELEKNILMAYLATKPKNSKHKVTI